MGILKNKNYMKMYIASLISRFGDSIDVIAFAFLVFQLTGSKMLLASVYIVNVLPNIVLGTFAGAIVDYYSKKKIIIFGDIARGVLVLSATMLYFSGMLQVWHLFVFTITMSTVEVFVAPCKAATIPKLIEEKDYMTVNSTMGSINRCAELGGMAAAGIIIGSMGVEAGLAVDAITFLISAVLISMVNFPEEDKKDFTINSYWKSYKEGFLFLSKSKIILSVAGSIAAIQFLLTPVNALSAAYVDEVLKMGAEGLSYINIAFALGGILGGFVANYIGKKLKLEYMIFVGIAMIGVFLSFLGLADYVSLVKPLYVAVLGMGMAGLALPMATSGLFTILMKNIPDDMRARVNSTMGVLFMSATPMGAFVSGILATTIGIPSLIILFSIIIIIISFIPTAVCLKYSRDEGQAVEYV